MIKIERIHMKFLTKAQAFLLGIKFQELKMGNVQSGKDT